MRNCEDVDLSDKNVGYLGAGVVGASNLNRIDEDSDPEKDEYPCFGTFRWLKRAHKSSQCRRCSYFGRCYLETVFMRGRKVN